MSSDPTTSAAAPTFASNPSRETGKSRGFGFVEMFDDEEAQEAIRQLDGYTVNNREIAVKQAEDRSNSRPAPRRDAPSRDSSGARPESRPDGTPPPPSSDAAPVKDFSKKKSFKTKSIYSICA